MLASPHPVLPWRIPIAIRLFLAILLTAVAVTLIGLWTQHMAMRDGFAHYVSTIEVKKLDGFVTFLQREYEHEGHWPAVQDQDKPFWLRHVYHAFTAEKHGHGGPFLHFRRHEQGDPAQEALHDGKPRQMPAMQDTGPMRDMPPAMPGMSAMPSSTPSAASSSMPRDITSNVPTSNPAQSQASGMPVPEMMSPDVMFQAPDMPMPPGMHPPFMRGGMDALDIGSRLGLLDASGNLIAGQAAPNDAPRLTLHQKGHVIGTLTLRPGIDPEDLPSTVFFLQQWRQLLWIGLACVLVSIMMAALLTRHFRRPIKALMISAEHLIQGQYDYRNKLLRSDELGDLGDTMNSLAHILSQHESSRRQWVADTSHELRTPVSVLRAQIEALQDGVRAASPAYVESMHRQIMSLTHLLDDIYDLARADIGQLSCNKQPIAPYGLVKAVSDGFIDPMQQQGLTLTYSLVDLGIMITADADRLRQIFFNLLENSRRYTDPGGIVRVTEAIHTLQKDTFWTVIVDDSLPSVSDDVLSHLGERFYRADSSRSRATGGSGLGLALSRQIAEMHGGTLHFEHSELGGLCAVLRVPCTLLKS